MNEGNNKIPYINSKGTVKLCSDNQEIKLMKPTNLRTNNQK